MKKTSNPTSPTASLGASQQPNDDKNVGAILKSPAELEKLEKEITALTQQVDQYKNQALRALADYQNLERRMHSERQTIIEQANMYLLRELVSMKEDMDKAEAFDKNPGLTLVLQKMVALLNKFGVAELTVMGKEFSPDTMECITVEAGKKDNIVTEVHEKGYTLHGKLLRPARVTVSKLQVSQPELADKI